MDNIHLKYLSLANYRNYDQLKLNFNQNLTVITGLNGAGKTTILDAIYYLLNGKSYFTALDRYIYRKGSEFFRIEGKLQVQDQGHEIKIISQQGKKKVFDLNDKKLKSRSELIGRFPAFMIAPRDILILMDSSVERRKVMDRTIAQSDRQYLNYLLTYNKLLKQRKAFLKEANKKGISNTLILDSINSQMIKPADYIYQSRAEYLRTIGPMVSNIYRDLSEDQEQINLSYQSELSQASLMELFKQNLRKDILLSKTSAGIHRDDIYITINGQPIKKYASQGQLKSAIIAVKIAQMEWIKKMTNKKPVLLLDDIFDKLDLKRVQCLLRLCSQKIASQIFITDTDRDRVVSSLAQLELVHQNFVINDGKLSH